MKAFFAGAILALSLGGVAFWFLNAPSPGEKVLESFYRDYLDHTMKQGSLPFSKDFNALWELNREVCVDKAGTDVCGFGADGDIYLDSQEVDPNLTFKNSEFHISETAPDRFLVSFNVYPTDIVNHANYDRQIEYLMKEEDGQWVVEDMISRNESARAQMQSEIDQY